MGQLPKANDTLSGEGRDQAVAVAFEMGVDDYIVKPYSPAELAARVRSALRRRESTGRATEVIPAE